MSPGGWRGPVESTFGFHIVGIDAVAAAEVTPLAHVEQRVLTDLLHQRQEESLARYYQNLSIKCEQSLEIGQFVIVAGALTLIWVIRNLGVSLSRKATLLPVYLVGGLAVYWFVDRSIRVVF